MAAGAALLLAVLQNNILFISFPRRLPTCFGGRSMVVLSPEIIVIVLLNC